MQYSVYIILVKKDFSVLGRALFKVHGAWFHEKKIYTTIKYNFNCKGDTQRSEVKMAVSETIKLDSVISPQNVH